MFGTLVICLPSKHEGGEVRVAYGGKEKILKTAESSEYGYTYLCWYVYFSLANGVLLSLIVGTEM
jgi:hypothetical protein